MAGGMINYVRIIESKPADVTVRAFRMIRKDTMELMGRHWHQNMLPLHFAPNAKYVYHYKRRTAAHEIRKARAAKRGRSGTRVVDRRAGTDSLTFSGTLRSNVQQIATIQAFEQRFKLIMPGTAYTPDKPKAPNQPPIAQEVTRLLEREKRVLAKLGKKFAVEQFKQIRSNKVTEIR